MDSSDSPDLPGGSFGANLKAARLWRGLSHEQLSLRAGIDMATIYRLEGDDRDPRLPTIVRLAEALGLSASDLVRGL